MPNEKEKEKKPCDIIVNSPIPFFECKSFDLSIYSQLQGFEKKALSACGVAKLDPEDSIKKMFFTDANYLDEYWLQRKGGFHNTDYNFQDTFLKPAENNPPIDMIIPRVIPQEAYKLEVKKQPTLLNQVKETIKKVAVFVGYIPEPGEEEEKKEEITDEQRFKRSELAWTQAPTNNLSHSIYLNIDLSQRELWKRSYTNLLFDCHPPSPPPPTPPELLKRQEKIIEILEYCISLTAEQIFILINIYFETERNRLFNILGKNIIDTKKAEIKKETKKPETTEEEDEETLRKRVSTEEGASEAFKKELTRLPEKKLTKKEREQAEKGRQILELDRMQEQMKKENQQIEVYQNNVRILLDLYNRIEDAKYEIQTLETSYDYMKQQIEKYRIGTTGQPNPATGIVDKAKDFSSIGLKSIYDYFVSNLATKFISQQLMQKVRSYQTIMATSRIPTQEELDELASEIKRQKQNLKIFTVNYSNALSRYKQSNTVFDTVYYIKSATEDFTDTLAGIPKKTPDELKAIKATQEGEYSNFLEQCELVRKTNKDIVKQALENTRKFIVEKTKETKQACITYELNPFQQKIFDIILQFPTTDKDSFQEYKNTLDLPFCPPKPEDTPPQVNEREAQKRSFVWISFESAIALLTRS